MDGTTAVLESGAEESLVIPDAADATVGELLDLTVRPEKIIISPDAPTAGWCAIRGRVNEVVYLGTSTQYAVTTTGGTELSVFAQNSSDATDIAQRNADVWLSWRPEHSLALARSSPEPTSG
jgi:spermidine/putrescine transport system ATP-binding protein